MTGVTMDITGLDAVEVAHSSDDDRELTPFGVRLRAAIEASPKYTSRAHFLRTLHRDPAQVYRYETGEREPPFDIVKEFAEALGVSVADLAGEDRMLSEDWTDTEAWLSLERSGRIDEFRRLGVPEENIQRARRWKWRGTPAPRDYERLLEADVLSAQQPPPPPQLAAARERRRAAGKPPVPLHPKKDRPPRQS